MAGDTGGFGVFPGIGNVVGSVLSMRKIHRAEKKIRRAQQAALAARSAAQAVRPTWVPPTPQRGVLRALPRATTTGAPPGTGSGTGVAGPPRTLEEWIYYLSQLGLTLWDWLGNRQLQQAADFDWSGWLASLGGVPAGGDDMATMIKYSTLSGLPSGYGVAAAGSGGSFWGGIGSALGQLASGALGQITGPMAYPGGAPIPGLQLPGLPGFTGFAPAGARLPTIFAGPGGRPARYLGSPLAWSGDVAACKRLKRAYTRIGKALPGVRRRGSFR